MAQTKILRGLIYGLATSLLLLILPCMALAHGRGERTTVMIGGYQVSLAITEPAKAGENLLHVQILDGMVLPVRGAQVEVSAMSRENMQAHQSSMDGMEGMEGMANGAHEMDGMSGMHGMSHAPKAVPAKEVEGDYVGVITFSTAGHWVLNIRFSINGQTLNVDFPVEVAGGSSSFAVAILAGFIGLNAFIIWVASFTKRTSSKRKPVVA